MISGKIVPYWLTCSPLGFEVMEATDGQDCLNQVLNVQPDVVLLDMVMPGMDGFEATKRLRQLPTQKDLVVIATSASAFAYDQQKCLAAGCDGFIPKPVQIEKLLEQLQVHLGLEWVYDDGSNIQNAESVGIPATIVPNQSELMTPTRLVAPPNDAIAALYELAMMGDIKGIQEQADFLEELDEQFVPFARQLHQLARGFQEKQILEFVRKFMAEHE